MIRKILTTGDGKIAYCISGAAHNANADKPDEVNSIIEGFLKNCRTTESRWR